LIAPADVPVTADLSHIKTATPFSCFFVTRYGGPSPPNVRLEAMKSQGELTVPGVVVMVIDDDLAVRNSLEFSLQIEGLTVRSYATGAELLSACDLNLCDCFVIDQKMPGMNGLDLIAILRDRHISAPAILITSQPSVSVRERAEKADIPIVEKPLLGNALLDKIRDVIRPREQ
jgi:two-component system, LuxR family, response regulator FixJ